MKSRVLAPIAIASLLLSCGPGPSESSESGQPTTAEINARLTEIIGTGLPEGATNVTIGQANLSASVFDCGFICTQADLDALIAASPRLTAARDAAAGDASGSYYLSTSWNATERQGAQFVLINLASIDEKTIAVDIGTTFIPGAELPAQGN